MPQCKELINQQEPRRNTCSANKSISSFVSKQSRELGTEGRKTVLTASVWMHVDPWGWQTAPRQAVPARGSRGSWCSGEQSGLATHKSHAGEGSGDALGGAGTQPCCGIRCKAVTLLLRPALDRSANPQLDYPGTLTVCADSKWELKRLCRR